MPDAECHLPLLTPGQAVAEDQVVLIASGDARLVANLAGWPDQQAMETKLAQVFAAEGVTVLRANGLRDGHGFIDSQRMGMDVFAGIDPYAKVVVAEAVWQFSHHVLAGLQFHKGPILTVANWSGQAPGLVGLLNLNGSMTKMGVSYSTVWSEDFTDPFLTSGIKQWLRTGKIRHDSAHVRTFRTGSISDVARATGERLANSLLASKAIMGVFDEGCMGMQNAIIDDSLLNKCGVFKERLSQSALLAEMALVADSEAEAVYSWLKDRGVTFVLGQDPASELTELQVLEQCKMYVAAVRLADAYSCDAIGIQYQLGLADMCAASDLAEGMLNSPDRPPVTHRLTGEELFAGKAVTHFNEADEGAGLDALVTTRVWSEFGWDTSTTLHDLRYGEDYDGEFVWVFLISGAAPATHFIGGYAGARSERQPPQYFKRGGGSLKGVSRPGHIVWSRIYVMDGVLNCDLGLAKVVELPEAETQRRWQATTPAWPIMHAVLEGVSRDQMMARHKSNHLNVVYAPDRESAQRGLEAKACMLNNLGVAVHLCGV